MLLYDFAVQILVQTLLDLGADYVATHGSDGNTYVSPNASDQWVNARVQAALKDFMDLRPVVGARRQVLALTLRPPRLARLIVSAVPGGYVVVVLGGLESWLSVSIARKLADAVENWAISRGTAWAPYPWSEL